MNWKKQLKIYERKERALAKRLNKLLNFKEVLYG